MQPHLHRYRLMIMGLLAALAASPARAQQTMPVNPWMQYLPQQAPAFSYSPFFPAFLFFQPKPEGARKPYTMRRIIPQQEKIQLMQMMLPIMTTFLRMDMADAMNYFARKYKAKPGLTFDDVKESLFLRANQLNFKFVGENLMWKDFRAVLNDHEAPRIEVYSFCDIAVGRDLLKISPEFIVFLPCRIAIMEDGDKNIWVLMLDWNLDWVAGYERQLGITDELWKGAIEINRKMDEIMRAAANGEL
ncbi:MAG: DUF302 domain-containing protein [Thiobacillaceae bacterium]|nr:DUF302 domain-containing protein [Thiobacillaceae bacterium]